MRIRTAATWVIPVLMAGCGPQAEERPPAAVAPQVTAEPDPVEEMKSLISEGREKLAASERYKLVDVTYDVRKSDSLVSPYDGVVNLQVKTDATRYTNAQNYKIQLNYTFRDGRWYFKSGEYARRTSAGIGFDDAILRGENYVEVKDAVDAFGAHDMND